MEPAVLINSHAARKVMGRVPFTRGRTLTMSPVFKGRALQGYAVILNGVPLTEHQVESLTGVVS